MGSMSICWLEPVPEPWLASSTLPGWIRHTRPGVSRRTYCLPGFFAFSPAAATGTCFYKYRFHQFGSMLRKYLDRLHMEQLVIPVTTISVDLVEGVPLVRECRLLRIS